MELAVECLSTSSRKNIRKFHLTASSSRSAIRYYFKNISLSQFKSKVYLSFLVKSNNYITPKYLFTRKSKQNKYVSYNIIFQAVPTWGRSCQGWICPVAMETSRSRTNTSSRHKKKISHKRIPRNLPPTPKKMCVFLIFCLRVWIWIFNYQYTGPDLPFCALNQQCLLAFRIYNINWQTQTKNSDRMWKEKWKNLVRVLL